MSTLPVEVVETNCPHCEQPSLTIAFYVYGFVGNEGLEFKELQQRCECTLAQNERNDVIHLARLLYGDGSYPHLRDRR